MIMLLLLLSSPVNNVTVRLPESIPKTKTSSGTYIRIPVMYQQWQIVGHSRCNFTGTDMRGSP